MFLDMMRDRVSIDMSTHLTHKMTKSALLVASNIGLASAIVGIVVVLGLDQSFYLGSGSIKLQPLFVDGLRYAVCCDSGVLKPTAHRLNGVRLRGKEVMNLFHSIMLAIFR